MHDTAVAVFTGKSFETIMHDGGSQSWVAKPDSVAKCAYLVCIRNRRQHWVEGPEPHGSAFLVGRVRGIMPSTETPGRWLIQIREFARVDIPKAWKGWRHPVRYLTLGDLGIDPASLQFEPMPQQSTEPNGGVPGPNDGVPELELAARVKHLELECLALAHTKQRLRQLQTEFARLEQGVMARLVGREDALEALDGRLQVLERRSSHLASVGDVLEALDRRLEALESPATAAG